MARTPLPEKKGGMKQRQNILFLCTFLSLIKKNSKTQIRYGFILWFSGLLYLFFQARELGYLSST
jgi:hypothetical protein